MNLSGTICYLQESFFLKTSKTFSLNLNQLYFSLGVKFKDLYNSNDFSQFSTTFQNFIEIYRLKENATIDKKISLVAIENCIQLEDNYLKESFHKKIKNFAYWCSKEWILEKESFRRQRSPLDSYVRGQNQVCERRTGERFRYLFRSNCFGSDCD